MNSHCSSNTSAGGAGTGRIVECELRLVHFTADDPVLAAAEAVIEFRVRRTGLSRFENMKAEQAVPEFQAMFQ